MEAVLTTRGLSFSYGNAAAVSDLELEIRRGDIFGFVGPNGAGKTTTIKLLLGLFTPSAGTIVAFGRSMAADRTAVLRRIGALVEVPSLYGHLTAEENLRIQAMAHGLGASQISEALDLVGLREVQRKKVRHFSLGMKQRLGIGLALLHRPELLVLDEPANGLDPAGIQDLRHMIRRLAAEQGMTVFLSSHILAELEQTATKVAIITRGRLRYQGTIDALKAGSGGRLRLTVDRSRVAAGLLVANGCEVTAVDGETLVVPAPDRELGATITAILVRGGVKVFEAVRDIPNLEDVFLDIVRAHEGDEQA